MRQEDAGPFAAARIVIGEVALQRLIALLVIDPLRLDRGRRRRGGKERDDGPGKKRREHARHAHRISSPDFRSREIIARPLAFACGRDAA
jgi:hypothetical protein